MTVTTTNNIEGNKILEYKGLVFGEVISGVDFVMGAAATMCNSPRKLIKLFF